MSCIVGLCLLCALVHFPSHTLLTKWLQRGDCLINGKDRMGNEEKKEVRDTTVTGEACEYKAELLQDRRA